jgi:hypothetical protein
MFASYLREPEIVAQQNAIHNGKRYWVSTVNTPDHGWETMIFAYVGDTDEKDWTDLYSRHYTTRDEAAAGHTAIMADFGAVPLRTDGDSHYYSWGSIPEADMDDGE